LIVINGGDSTNEEMVHWLGFAAQARGWNCLVFEGPGQWSAMQLNPGLYMRPDYEVPVKAAVDFLLQRADVDPDKIALFGPSLGAILAARAAAFEKRIKAVICDGLIVDVYEGWHAVWPRALQNARPGAFDTVFTSLEKVSPQLHGMANHFRWMLGVNKPHEIIEAWKPYNIKNLTPQLSCPMLLIYGEGEAAQSNEKVGLSILRFVKELSCPVTIHLFGFDEGWAASHCQIGALAPLQAVVFDWLDKTVNTKDSSPQQDFSPLFGVLKKYMRSNEARHEAEELFKNQQTEAVSA
jgi:pimeloyl-ACP methyl ester carboxylesterase